jgi:prepilin-type N-terminal cleavage/methylation domain-containing protein
LNTKRGFTLIEVVITAGILACGLAAVAAVFSFVIRTNTANRQMTVASMLLYSKLEEFRAASFSDSIWNDPAGSEVVTAGERFVRVWQIGADVPRTVTVIVYTSGIGSAPQKELIRATMLANPVF